MDVRAAPAEWELSPDFDPARARRDRVMTRERLYLFDTTLRDGQQSQGVDFSVEDKAAIARALDELGIDYVEGGWPGRQPDRQRLLRRRADARPRTPHRLRHDQALGPLGRERRGAGRRCSNAGTPAVCLVGKTHDFHVATALGISARREPREHRHLGRAPDGQGPRGAVRRRALLRRLEGQPRLRARLPEGRARRRRPLGGALRHQRRHAARRGRRDHRARSSPPASPATGSASTPTTTPATRSPTRSPRSTPARARCRAR